MRRLAPLAACLALAAACATPAPAVREAGDALGVKVEGVRLSAAGYLLDFRYRVLDAQKARALFERQARPMLVDGNGLQLAVPNAPKIGQLRATSSRGVKEGRTYSMLFANPGRHVERGAKLAFVVGDNRIDGLVVD
jgi:hypothetical protein